MCLIKSQHFYTNKHTVAIHIYMQSFKPFSKQLKGIYCYV